MSGDDANEGDTWGTAVCTLGKAFELARDNQEADTIRVTEGTYVLDSPSQHGDPKSKSFLFTGQLGLIVLGGYPAVGPQVNEERDPAAFVSILNADINQDDPAEFDDNSCQPVWFRDATDDFRLDGFRIERGIATNALSPEFLYRSSGGVGASDLAVLLGALGQCWSSVEGGAGGEMAASVASACGMVSPALAAELFGFGSIDAIAAWLGSLPTSERNAILFALFTEAGGDL